ncbi:unnamed protein product [Cyclocybe aegerita]|uniref:HMG box domain-containing protein n=1 Tax=Cyclocybe aegerita TaxID=1973307 RepID=A0A8S0VT87_CYCAE|nr:unnamed protein product [Cyclocybe aegerita]
MTSISEVKQEERSGPLQLHLAAPGSIEWSPTFKISTPQLPIQPLFPSYDEVPVAKANRGPYRHDRSSPLLSMPPSPPLSLHFPSDPSASRFASSNLLPQPDDSPSRHRIPRPPNAFMLFRSDFLKRGVIPNNVERRQQNLSRIAGQVWNMLDPEEKAHWHEQAAQVLNEHQLKNPNYKFTPAPRGSRQSKSKAREENPAMGDDDIRRIRERYARVIGPSPTSNRKRRHHKKARSVEVGDRFPTQAFPPSTNPAVHTFCSPPLPLGYMPVWVQHHQLFQGGSSFPVPTVPRRPSTSLGFAESKNDAMSAGGPHDGYSAPASPNTGPGFHKFINNNYHHTTLGQSSAPVAHPSPVEVNDALVYPPWNAFNSSLVAPQLSIPGSPIHPQLAGPSASTSASAPATCPSSTPQSPFIPSPIEETDALPTCFLEQTHAAENHNPFEALGINDDMLSFLKAPYDDGPSFLSDDAKEQFWCPGTDSLEQWDFQGDLDDTLTGLFAMGDYKDTSA